MSLGFGGGVPVAVGVGLGGVSDAVGEAVGVAVAVAVGVAVGVPSPLQYISIELSGVTPSDAYPPTSQIW